MKIGRPKKVPRISSFIRCFDDNGGNPKANAMQHIFSAYMIIIRRFLKKQGYITIGSTTSWSDGKDWVDVRADILRRFRLDQLITPALYDKHHDNDVHSRKKGEQYIVGLVIYDIEYGIRGEDEEVLRVVPDCGDPWRWVPVNGFELKVDHTISGNPYVVEY